MCRSPQALGAATPERVRACGRNFRDADAGEAREMRGGCGKFPNHGIYKSYAGR